MLDAAVADPGVVAQADPAERGPAAELGDGGVLQALQGVVAEVEALKLGQAVEGRGP